MMCSCVKIYMGLRHSALMPTAIDSRLSGLCLSLGRGHGVVFLGKTFKCLSSSVYMGTGKLNAGTAID